MFNNLRGFVFCIFFQEMIITELQAETTYSVTVAAYTTKGDGARSKPKLATTTGAGNVTGRLIRHKYGYLVLKTCPFLHFHH